MTDISSIFPQFFGQCRLLECAPIGQGNINDTYWVEYEAERGAADKAVLQRLNTKVFAFPEQVMHNTLLVCRHLEGAGYPYRIPMPLPTVGGGYLAYDATGQAWRAFPYFPGTFAPEGSADAGTAYEAAKAYGAFARGLRDLPMGELAETIPGFHDTDRRWADFVGTLARDPAGRRGSCADEVAAVWGLKPVFDRIGSLKRSGALPLRAAHNDAKAGNILFDQNSRQAVAVIDLDTVMPGTVLSDFGDMARSFVPTTAEDSPELPTVRQEVLEALLKGYLEATAGFLTDAEQANLVLGAAWMAGEQAMRFLTDYLAGDVYYKTAHPRHNLVRAQNQLALSEALQSSSLGKVMLNTVDLSPRLSST